MEEDKVYIVYDILDYGLTDMNDIKVFYDEDMAQQYALENALFITSRDITIEY